MKITAEISSYTFNEIAASLTIEGAGRVRVKLEKSYSPEGWSVTGDGIRPESGSVEEGAIVNAVATAMSALADTIVQRKP